MRTTTAQSDAAESPSKTDAPADARVDKRERLRRFLRERTAQEGECYVKSKFISDDVGLSPKEIGALMVQLQESAADLEIEKWAYTSATTWRVAPA